MFLTYRKTLCQWLLPLLLTHSVLSANSAETGYFPEDVKICSTRDPNFNTCFTESANRMLKQLIQGSRQINAVPMDPLNIPSMSLARNNSLLPTLAFNYTDLVYRGWKDGVLLRSMINPKNHNFNMVFNIPRSTMRNSYEIAGSIIGIPLEGSGIANFTFYNVTKDIQMRGNLEQRNGQEFLVIEDFRLKAHVGRAEFNFDNLSNNTKLTEVINRLLNLSNREVLDVGSGFINELWGTMYAGLMQRIFDRVPYSVMFPDME